MTKLDAVAGHIDWPEPEGDSDMWTAAIDLPGHGAAIECHGSTQEEAVARRDCILTALTETEVVNTHRINSDNTVAVSLETFWLDDMASCPRGVKVQLLGAGGCAHYGVYNGDPFYIGWYPVPARRIK